MRKGEILIETSTLLHTNLPPLPTIHHFFQDIISDPRTSTIGSSQVFRNCLSEKFKVNVFTVNHNGHLKTTLTFFDT